MASQRRTWPVAGGIGMEGSAQMVAPNRHPHFRASQVVSYFGKDSSKQQNHYTTQAVKAELALRGQATEAHSPSGSQHGLQQVRASEAFSLPSLYFSNMSTSI